MLSTHPNISTLSLACKVVQIRLIFSPISPDRAIASQVYIYGEFFKFSTANRTAIEGPTGDVEVFIPEPGIDMFVLYRHLRSSGQRMGDVIQLVDVREIVELATKSDSHTGSMGDFTCDTSLEHNGPFYLNNFADKENFHSILTYQ